MNYHLALQLKKDHFPQGLTPNSEYYIAPDIIMRRKDIFQHVFHDNPKEMTTTNLFVYKPKLEELLEATEARLFPYFDQEKYDGWMAQIIINDPDSVARGTTKEVRGKTPAEALANMWIKLREQM